MSTKDQTEVEQALEVIHGWMAGSPFSEKKDIQGYMNAVAERVRLFDGVIIPTDDYVDFVLAARPAFKDAKNVSVEEEK